MALPGGESVPVRYEAGPSGPDAFGLLVPDFGLELTRTVAGVPGQIHETKPNCVALGFDFHRRICT